MGDPFTDPFMNMKIAIWIQLLFSFTCLACAQTESKITIVDYEIGIPGVKQDASVIEGFNQKSSKAEQLSFLTQLLEQTKGVSVSDTPEASARETTAILLLGRLKTPDAFQAILENITHQDARTHIYPAISALENFDPAYIETLIAFVDHSKTALEQSIAVQALTKIVNKSGNYADFLQEQSKRASPALYKKLLLYTAD